LFVDYFKTVLVKMFDSETSIHYCNASTCFTACDLRDRIDRND